MRSKAQVKQSILDALERRRDEIIAIGEQIMQEPELGFKEFKTARRVVDVFEQLGIPYRNGLAITGVKGRLQGVRPGPTFALLGELDSLVVFEHPQANPETGAAHACGHNAQIAGLLGAAMALTEADVADAISGNIVFFAVPAEEYVEVEYRARLVEEGKIEFLGGKPEMIRLGHFDDIDMAMMIHTSSDKDMIAGIADSSNGCVVKLIRYLGKAAHAGGAPHKGINALNAAMLGLSGIHALRETFQDGDTIRVHPIITHGGDLVNVVPALVRMETFVRGKTNEAIQDANEKVDRALKAGALAIGATVEIQTLPGYMPMANNSELATTFKENVIPIVGEDKFTQGGHRTGSTDMGDVTHIMPAIHPYIGGAKGTGHSAEWHIADPELGYLAPARALALTAVDMLYGDAEPARRILESSKPLMTKEEYLAYQRQVISTETYGDQVLSLACSGKIG